MVTKKASFFALRRVVHKLPLPQTLADMLQIGKIECLLCECGAGTSWECVRA